MCDYLPGKRCATDTRAVLEDTLAAYYEIGWGQPSDRPEVNTLIASEVVALGIRAHKRNKHRDAHFQSYKAALQAMRDKHTDANGVLDEAAFVQEAMVWRDEQIKAAAKRRFKQLERRKVKTAATQDELAKLRRIVRTPIAAPPFMPPDAVPGNTRPEHEWAAEDFAGEPERVHRGEAMDKYGLAHPGGPELSPAGQGTDGRGRLATGRLVAEHAKAHSA